VQHGYFFLSCQVFFEKRRIFENEVLTVEDLNVIIAGAAGEGIETIGLVLAGTLASLGYHVFTWQEYESRIRGGHNSYCIRISERPKNAPVEGADILLALNKGAANKYERFLNQDGIIVSPEKGDDHRRLTISFSEVAKENFGSKIYANSVAAGSLAQILGIEVDALLKVLEEKFSKKGQEVIDANRKAAQKGAAIAGEQCKDLCPWKLTEKKATTYRITGNEAIALGAVYGGCRFMAAYPMSPSTGIITYLAKYEKEFKVFTEQAEDEIAAVNMAIGAGYAGARAMTATSGGGFALMAEGISLAGMTETPLVVVLAQRPGPATGLPTRTAQGDLLFALHAGHGEFPRMILAPADPKDAFHKMVKAFNMADKYQIPVTVLTDQYLADSGFSIEDFEPDQSKPVSFLGDASAISDYKRYALGSDSGVSPRLYPGQSDHLVCADSDEHDEAGHITEDLDGMALPMSEKRLAKLDGLRREIAAPEKKAVEKAEIVFVGWGSSRQAILEALALLENDGIRAGMIHFTEIWPFPDFSFPEEKSYWSVEGNATGQLAGLLKSRFSVNFQGHIGRYDGLPLTARYIIRNMSHG
jgi:2-oxoglutarate/2-oxoacid ferredoxin oxidoreductase subunit alpha